MRVFKNWPSKRQWLQILGVLGEREKKVFLLSLFLFLGSALALSAVFYFDKTEIKPAVGGSFTEGVVGSPRFINPVYAQGSDIDRDLAQLIFSGLMKYDGKGNIVPDMAEKVDVLDQGKTYEVSLKENLFWHDGQKVTAKDIIFTIETIQNPDYKSPLRANYIGVKMEKKDDLNIVFKLQESYEGFLERLTLPMIPAHVWENVSPQNFILSSYNLRPIGSGPYRFKELEQNKEGKITSMKLIRFNDYYSNSEAPFLREINFRFFENEEDLISQAKKGRLQGFSLSDPSDFEKSGLKKHSLSLPRYFAVFFNSDQSGFLREEKIRKALNYATDKKEIINELFGKSASPVDSPILPGFYGFQRPLEIYGHDKEQAQSLLADSGLEKKDGFWFKVDEGSSSELKSDLREGSQSAEVTALQTCLAEDPEVYPEGKITGYFGSQTKEAVIRFQEKYSKDILEPWGFNQGTGLVGQTTRDKLNEVCSEPAEETPLKFVLATVEDPILEKVASILKEQWQEVGIQLEVVSYPASQLEKDIIKPRNYQMILFGEVLNLIPDLFPFWHSSQTKDPGLNLSQYENPNADKFLEQARVSTDFQEKAENYAQLQNLLIEEAPAVFLYSPKYVYFLSENIEGMEVQLIADPSGRFCDIEEWYVKTKRRWK